MIDLAKVHIGAVLSVQETRKLIYLYITVFQCIADNSLQSKFCKNTCWLVILCRTSSIYIFLRFRQSLSNAFECHLLDIQTWNLLALWLRQLLQTSLLSNPAHWFCSMSVSYQQGHKPYEFQTKAFSYESWFINMQMNANGRVYTQVAWSLPHIETWIINIRRILKSTSDVLFSKYDALYGRLR